MNSVTLFKLLKFIVILVCGFCCSFEDIKTMKVTNWIIWAGCGVILILDVIFCLQNFWIYLISAVISFTVYFFIHIKTKKFGIGDVYFGILQGLCLIPQFLPVCMGLEVVIATIFAFHTRKLKIRFPFIPFMATGLLISYIIYCFCC